MAAEGGARAHRLFFAVWPDASVSRALHGLARDAQKQCGGRLMRRETLHLTLAFLGDVPDVRMAEVRAAAAAVSFRPVTLRLDRLGYWRHNRILWAGCTETPPELAEAVDRLGTELSERGFVLERRPFAAHITLLRQANCTATPTLEVPVLWPVGEFVLVESTLEAAGARYEALGHWPPRPAYQA